MKTQNPSIPVGDLAPTEPLSPLDQELLDDAGRNAVAARVPFSGGADKVWSTTRGAETAARALARMRAAVRR